MNFENNVRSYYEAQASGESLGRYTAKTFGWMFAGLMVTFIVAVGNCLCILYSLLVLSASDCGGGNRDFPVRQD